MKNQAMKRFSKSMKLAVVASAGAASFVALLANPPSVDAAIKCDGPFQLIKGVGPHATPYCEDNFLARIARRTYGWKVSNRAIRNNPNLKARVCRQIGHDYRLTDICANHRPGSSRGGGLF